MTNDPDRFDETDEHDEATGERLVSTVQRHQRRLSADEAEDETLQQRRQRLAQEDAQSAAEDRDPYAAFDGRELFKQPGREPMSEDAISAMQRRQADLLERGAALSALGKGEGAIGSVQGVPGWTHNRPDASLSPSLYDRVTKLEHAVEALSRYLTKSDGD